MYSKHAPKDVRDVRDIILKNMSAPILQYSKVIDVLLRVKPTLTLEFITILKAKGIAKTFEMLPNSSVAKEAKAQIFLQMVQDVFVFTFGKDGFNNEDIWKVIECFELSADDFINICKNKQTRK